MMFESNEVIYIVWAKMLEDKKKIDGLVTPSKGCHIYICENNPILKVR
jgi:hypothetical protein